MCLMVVFGGGRLTVSNDVWVSIRQQIDRGRHHRRPDGDTADAADAGR